MTDRSIVGLISSPRALFCSLPLALGLIAGCGTTNETPPLQGSTAGTVEQAVFERFDQPYNPFPGAVAPPCEDNPDFADLRQELLTPSDTDKFSEIPEIQCSLTLTKDEVIRRRIRFGPSSKGVVLDCQDQLRPTDSKGNMLVPEGGVLKPGASISRHADAEVIGIRSSVETNDDGTLAKDDGTGFYVSDRPENIVIRNCTIEGKVGISGLPGRDSQNQSSHDASGIVNGRATGPTHVDRARAVAPTNILFDNVDLVAMGSTPLYVYSGVTRFTMKDSVVEGRSGGAVGIYFDQESAENTILNSSLSVVSDRAYDIPIPTIPPVIVPIPLSSREEVAMDATSYNFMVGNRVSGLDNGGFMLYRNCGEHKTIRYSTPSWNTIVNNHFVYRHFTQPVLNSRKRYAVYMSSRNGPYGRNDYCGDDRKDDPNFPTDIDTSYVTRDDNAHDNIVTNNEFLNRTPKNYMKSGTSLYNFTAGNRNVSEFSSDKKACYAPWTYGRVLLDGNTDHVKTTIDGQSVCFAYKCNNGELEAVNDPTCPNRGVPIRFECRADQDNDGCQNILSCPQGQRVISVKAACNLESGSVSDTDLGSVPAGNVRVVKASDNVSDGSCYVLGTTLSSGMQHVTVNPNIRTVNIGCKEKDSNGGDCHVRAEFTCD